MEYESGVFHYLQRAGIFGGLVLVPIAVILQTFELSALFICGVGFVLYSVGLMVFGKIANQTGLTDFARTGRLVCGAAYLAASLSATSTALIPSAKNEFQARFSKEVVTQIELLSAKQGKTYEIPTADIPAGIQQANAIAGLISEKTVKVATLATVTHPILGAILEKVDYIFWVVFMAATIIAVFSILVAVFVLPLMPLGSGIKKPSSDGAAT